MKKIITTIATLAACLIFSMTSFAGTWQQDSTGWWWQNDDGSWPASQWEWLDGNRDGLAECYYFDNRGYCMLNAVTPDGYHVNADGAWTENGAVQYRQTNVFANTINVVTYNNYGGYMDASQNSWYGFSGYGNDSFMDEPGTPGEDYIVADDEDDRMKGEGCSVRPEKSSAVHLSALTPVMKSGMRVVNPCKTSLGESWGETIELSREDYAEYYTAGAYSEFSACVAPEWGISDDAEVSFSVYGDDELLYSFSMTYRSAPEEILVDITGCDFVTIKASRTGWNGKVLVGDAKFL